MWRKRVGAKFREGPFAVDRRIEPAVPPVDVAITDIWHLRRWDNVTVAGFARQHPFYHTTNLSLVCADKAAEPKAIPRRALLVAKSRGEVWRGHRNLWRSRLPGWDVQSREVGEAAKEAVVAMPR
jgi:hypothetical protein